MVHPLLGQLCAAPDGTIGRIVHVGDDDNADTVVKVISFRTQSQDPWCLTSDWVCEWLRPTLTRWRVGNLLILPPLKSPWETLMTAMVLSAHLPDEGKVHGPGRKARNR